MNQFKSPPRRPALRRAAAGWLISCAYLAYGLQLYELRGGALAAWLCLWASTTVHLPFTVGYHQLLCISPRALREWRTLDVRGGGGRGHAACMVQLPCA